MSNPVVRFEVVGQDADKLRQFYGELLGWEFQVSHPTRYGRVHADDCAECESEDRGMIERVRSEVAIHGSFTEAQRARMAQIVERCPVHKTLTRGVRIFDSVSFDAAA